MQIDFYSSLVARRLVSASTDYKESTMDGDLRIRELQDLSITVVTDNYYDALRPDTAVSKRFRIGPGTSMHAEHGLSYVVRTVTDDGESGCLMFDYGVDVDGVTRNMKNLGIDMAAIDALGLSHGHFDHWGAFLELVERNQRVIRAGIPFYVGSGAFLHRFARLAGDGGFMDLGVLEREEIEGKNILKIVEITEPTELIPGAYATGSIERLTSYEQIPAAFVVERNEGLEQDVFEGEQAIVFVVKGKGLVVLSGCAHVGIVNTVIRAKEMTGVEHIHAVIGGFHLVNAREETVEATVADIKAMEPDYIIPTHCTGFEAMMRFREEMPGQFLLNTAGTTYTFGATPE
jgi:7,8-dihydropterin-6-yl-methyl-4-(beta-D-ribofuranosyl)aminobenzene 5'-phosphate synthase